MPNTFDAKVDTATANGNTIVAAVAGKRIVLLSYLLVAGGTVSVKWQSGSTDKTGAMPMVANGSLRHGPAPFGGDLQNGLLTTAVGEALTLHLSGAVQVSGHVTYTVEP